MGPSACALGFLLTLGTRSEARVQVAVGEDFTGEPGQYLSQSPPRMLSLGMLPVRFRVDAIRPEFWRDELLFTNLEADLVLEGGGRESCSLPRRVQACDGNRALTLRESMGQGIACRWMC